METKLLLRLAMLKTLESNDGSFIDLQDQLIEVLESLRESLLKYVEQERRSHLKLVKLEP